MENSEQRPARVNDVIEYGQDIPANVVRMRDRVTTDPDECWVRSGAESFYYLQANGTCGDRMPSAALKEFPRWWPMMVVEVDPEPQPAEPEAVLLDLVRQYGAERESVGGYTPDRGELQREKAQAAIDAADNLFGRITTLVKSEERDGLQVITERDDAHDWADRLAQAIAEFLHIDIGEHSNMNLPWQAALIALTDTVSPQPAEHCEHWSDGDGSCCQCGEPNWCPNGVDAAAERRFERRKACPGPTPQPAESGPLVSDDEAARMIRVFDAVRRIAHERLIEDQYASAHTKTVGQALLDVVNGPILVAKPGGPRVLTLPEIPAEAVALIGETGSRYVRDPLRKDRWRLEAAGNVPGLPVIEVFRVERSVTVEMAPPPEPRTWPKLDEVADWPELVDVVRDGGTTERFNMFAGRYRSDARQGYWSLHELRQHGEVREVLGNV